MTTVTSLLEWKVVPGFPGYEASTQGQLRCRKKNKILNVSPNGVYLQDASGKKTRHKLHIWIALTFVPNPDPLRYTRVIIKNALLADVVHADNLVWGTQQEPVAANTAVPLPPSARILSLSQTDAYTKVLRKYKCQQQQNWDRLSSKHGKRQENGCIEAKTEYHNVKMGSFSIRIHKLAYFLFEDNIDLARISEDGLVIRHKCGNAKCFEPSHLEIGTPSQNLYDDKIRDGTMICGVKHGRCTITEEAAKAIIASKMKRGDEGYMTRKARAERFKVTERLVKHIDAGNAWAHLQSRSPRDKVVVRIQATKKARRARAKAWTSDMFNAAAARIRAKTEVVECKDATVPGCCHEWRGKLNPSGYGYFTIHGKQALVHIVALECHVQRHRNPQKLTLHRCGNKLCCNPEHLTFGDARQNALDAIRHGHKGAKIDQAVAQQVLDMLAAGKPKKAVVQELNLTEGIVRHIATGRTWQHITQPASDS